jgi:hypothetical protein
MYMHGTHIVHCILVIKKFLLKNILSNNYDVVFCAKNREKTTQANDKFIEHRCQETKLNWYQTCGRFEFFVFHKLYVDELHAHCAIP